MWKIKHIKHVYKEGARACSSDPEVQWLHEDVLTVTASSATLGEAGGGVLISFSFSDGLMRTRIWKIVIALEGLVRKLLKFWVSGPKIFS